MATGLATDRTEPGAAARHRYIGGIDGLRALAVLSIVLFHVDAAWLPGGFVGVDVFFVISGFVVAHSVAGARVEGFAAYFAWFYRRRFLRILPALFVFIAVAALVGVIFLPTGLATKYIELTGVASVFALGNVALLWKTGDYFASTAEFNTFTHLWSLGVEEQYYLIFPLFSYWLLVKHDVAPTRRRAIGALLWAAIAASLAAAAWFTARRPDFAFFMLPTRFWELGLGFVVRHHVDGRPRSAVVARLSGAAGLAALAALLATFWLTDAHAFPFPGALAPCLATAALILSVWRFPGGAADRLLSWRPLRGIGAISYSLYLWHWGVLVLMRWTVGIDTPGLRAIALLMTAALALISYYVIERPLRGAGRLRRASDLGFFGGCALAAGVTALACVALLAAKPRMGLSATNRIAVWSGDSVPPATPGCPIAESKEPFAGGWAYHITPSCRGPAAGRVFAVGDSHVGTYLRLYRRYAAISGREVHAYTQAGCIFVDQADEPPSPACETFRRSFADRMPNELTAADTLFLPGNYTARYRDSWELTIAVPDPVAVASAAAGRAAVARSLARLRPFAARGALILFEMPKPTMPTALFRCADWYDRANDYCAPGWHVSRQAMILRSAAPRAMLERIARDLPRVATWEPMAPLCPGAACDGYRDGKPLYFDTDHPSGYANDLLLPSFAAVAQATRDPPATGASPRSRQRH